MKLYNVPRDSKIRLLNDAVVPPHSRAVFEGEILDFDHVDGMYSYCKDKEGEIVHIGVMTDVEIVKDD